MMQHVSAMGSAPDYLQPGLSGERREGLRPALPLLDLPLDFFGHHRGKAAINSRPRTQGLAEPLHLLHAITPVPEEGVQQVLVSQQQLDAHWNQEGILAGLLALHPPSPTVGYTPL